MIAVICDSRREFNDFLKNIQQTKDRNKFVCVFSSEHLRGLMLTEYIVVGEFSNKKEELEREAFTRIR